MSIDRDLLCLLQSLRGQLDGAASLDALAERSGWSPFHLHRAFRRVVGETPKQYTQRLRLERAAAALAASRHSVMSIAAAVGFNSHAVFTRAFRRHFGITPAQYRATALRGASPRMRAQHVETAGATGPCVGLYHLSLDRSFRSDSMPTPVISRQVIEAQPMLFIRRRVARHEIATTLGECLPKVFMHAHKVGLAMAGRPFTRYSSPGLGLVTIEAGHPLAAAAALGEGEIEAGVLQGGPAAVAIHMGAYHQLATTYAAIEQWIESNGLRSGGAPWESYITDPAEHPSPADWRTDVYWPLAE